MNGFEAHEIHELSRCIVLLEQLHYYQPKGYCKWLQVLDFLCFQMMYHHVFIWANIGAFLYSWATGAATFTQTFALIGCSKFDCYFWRSLDLLDICFGCYCFNHRNHQTSPLLCSSFGASFHRLNWVFWSFQKRHCRKLGIPRQKGLHQPTSMCWIRNRVRPLDFYNLPIISWAPLTGA